MASTFGLLHDARLGYKALACLSASIATRRATIAAESRDRRDRSPGQDIPDPPPHCSIRTSSAGRGLYVTKAISQREVILEDMAVVDSSCPQEVVQKVFSSRPPEPARLQREPIWGLVANFVQLLQDGLPPKHGSSRIEEAAQDRQRRLSLMAAFYRPEVEDAQSNLYKQHAEELHKAMDQTSQETVASEVVADLLTVVRLDAHIVREAKRPGEKDRNGLGLFFWLHLANHSCCPNAFFHTTCEKGRAKATLYALRPLDCGEEVCISYVDGQTLLSPVQVRRRIIQSQFGFVCGCNRCQEEENRAGRVGRAGRASPAAEV